MSLITFRDKNTKGEPVGPTWYLQFDALTVEEFTRSADVTQYPVETGAILSDHYQPQPRQIRLLGVVSDTPASQPFSIDKKQNAAAQPAMAVQPLALTVRPEPARVGRVGVPRPISTTVLPSRRLVRANLDRARLYIPKFAMTLQVVSGSSFARSGITRIANFMSVLDGLMESRTPVTVVLQTGAEHQNMMIVEHRAPRVSGRSGQITFEIDMQEVVYADPAQTTAAAVAQPEEPKHDKKKATGKKGTRAPKSKEQSRFQRDVAPAILRGSRGQIWEGVPFDF